MVRSKLCGCRRRCEDGEILFFNDRCFIGDRESIAVSLATVSPEFNPTSIILCLSLKTLCLLITLRLSLPPSLLTLYRAVHNRTTGKESKSQAAVMQNIFYN